MKLIEVKLTSLKQYFSKRLMLHKDVKYSTILNSNN